jgi:glutamate-1-semialdehyde 2,1-aminomutase
MTWTNSKNREWQERAQAVIPGGMYGHEATLMLPECFPQFFSRADGAHIWDVDGNRYIDFMCAFGPNLLGYHHPAIDAAAQRQAQLGDTLTGPSPVMVELAEQFVSMISHAQWAMFCKNGSDATSMAMVIARAYAGRRKIIVATGAYHGAAPWNTPNRTGTLPEDRAHVVYVDYNDPESLERAFREHRGDIAGLFATPFKHEVFADQVLPDPLYAQRARALCDAEDALLIVDDVRAGFRLARDCSWSLLGVEPDLSCWGKVLANGHALSALLGSEKVRSAARSIFVTGSFWFSAVAMAAGLATLHEIRHSDYLERMAALGEQFRQGLAARAQAAGFSLKQTGPAHMPQILFEDDPDMRLGFHWTSAALRYGVYLHPYHNMFFNAAMTEMHVQQALEGAERAFADLRGARHLVGPNGNALVRKRLNLPALQGVGL